MRVLLRSPMAFSRHMTLLRCGPLWRLRGAEEQKRSRQSLTWKASWKQCFAAADAVCIWQMPAIVQPVVMMAH